MKELLNPPAIYGEVHAGASSKLKTSIENLVTDLNSSTFTLAEKLHEAKINGYVTAWGYQTMGEFFKAINLKSSKGHYLIRIVNSMLVANIDRVVYEPVGIAKLRVITRLDPLADYDKVPAVDIIKNLVEVAKDVDVEVLEEAVAKYLGQTEEEAQVWLNVKMNKSARDNVVKSALEKARMHIGTVSTDEDGKGKDASDGRCLELICADYLAGA